MLVLDADNARLGVGDEIGIVRVWDIRSGSVLGTWGHPNRRAVGKLDFVDAETLAINFWDFRAVESGHAPTSAYLKPPAQLYTSMTGVWLWNYVETPQYDPDGHSPWIVGSVFAFNAYSTTFNSTREVVVVVERGQVNNTRQTVNGRVFRVADSSLVGIINDEMWSFRYIAFHPTDARQLATVSEQGVVRLWTLEGAPDRIGEWRAFATISEAITLLTYNADGSLVATGGTDGQVRIWETATGKLQAVYGEQPAIHQLRFMADGALWGYSAADAIMRVWDVRTGDTVIAYAREGTP
jgi:WD40 repeat protein